jgi:glutamate carboxypeptidase
MNATDFLSFFESRQRHILQFVRELVEIESPSYDETGSRQIVALIEARRLKIVDSIERISVPGLGEHLIVRAFSDLPGKPILLLGHTDTVHPRGSLAARPFKIEDGKVFAPGIFDMKSGCVLMFEALRAFEILGLKPFCPIVILLSCDEEIGSPTGREIVEREAGKSAFCLVVEPSAPGGRVKTGRKGTSSYTLRAHGLPAHAGLEPEKGASAILEISGQILQLHGLEKPEIGTTVNVCTIRGGTATNVIPAEAECSIDVRFSQMSEATRIENEIKGLKPLNERVSLEILGEINRPPLERTKSVASLYEKARTIAATFDYQLNETQVGGASDGNFVAALGVPVLDGLGIQGDGAHTHYEHILLSDISKRATLLASLLLEG